MLLLNTFCRVIVQIEKLILVQPRGSKNANAKNINIMDDAQDPCGHGQDAMGESQEIHKRAESHSNDGDVEDPICV